MNPESIKSAGEGGTCQGSQRQQQPPLPAATGACPSPSTDHNNIMISEKERVVAKTDNTPMSTDHDNHRKQQRKRRKSEGINGGDDDDDLDWVLTNYDEKNSEPQSLEEELKRLQTLRSYLVLDSERETQFERLTALASRVLDVPIALISLVDLGRQWFVSTENNKTIEGVECRSPVPN